MLINGTYNAKTLNQWLEFLLKEINLAQSGVMNHARFQASQKIKECAASVDQGFLLPS